MINGGVKVLEWTNVANKTLFEAITNRIYQLIWDFTIWVRRGKTSPRVISKSKWYSWILLYHYGLMEKFLEEPLNKLQNAKEIFLL
jgi:hypothetical protein